MYGNAYMAWREAEDILAKLDRAVEDAEPDTRALVLARLRDRYTPPPQLVQRDLNFLLQQQQQRDLARVPSNGPSLLGGIFSL